MQPIQNTYTFDRKTTATDQHKRSVARSLYEKSVAAEKNRQIELKWWRHEPIEAVETRRRAAWPGAGAVGGLWIDLVGHSSRATSVAYTYNVWILVARVHPISTYTKGNSCRCYSLIVEFTLFFLARSTCSFALLPIMSINLSLLCLPLSRGQNPKRL